MKILKAINNNIVSAVDASGVEIVVMGRGLGYHARVGGEVPEDLVEKVFRMSSQNLTDKFIALLADIPLEHIKICDEIIAYAKQMLGERLNQSIYLTLTDHINFALSRHRQGMMFQNALLREVRRFYNQEYRIGEYAINLIGERLGVSLPDDEAASIALHIVNAEYDTSIGEAVSVTRIIEEITGVVKTQLGTITEDGFYYDRFITHLKFLAQRVIRHESPAGGDRAFNKMVEELYPRETACAGEISKLLAQGHDYFVPPEELAYLAVHLKRIQMPQDSNAEKF